MNSNLLISVTKLTRYRLFACLIQNQSHLLRGQIKENIKAPHHWPLCGEFTCDRWIPRTRGQLRGKCFHVMTSLCEMRLWDYAMINNYINSLYRYNYSSIPNFNDSLTKPPWKLGHSMMTSSNGNIFRVTGHLCGEFTGPRWIPHTKASDAELWYFLWSAPQ